MKRGEVKPSVGGGETSVQKVKEQQLTVLKSAYCYAVTVFFVLLRLLTQTGWIYNALCFPLKGAVLSN